MLYPVAVESGSATEAYGVSVPDLKGCFSAGDTFEEALENIKVAIVEHLEILAEDGADIPLASEVSRYFAAEEYKGCTWDVIDIKQSH